MERDALRTFSPENDSFQGEVLCWVLSFGSQAKVLAPPELVKLVRAEIDAMKGA